MLTCFGTIFFTLRLLPVAEVGVLLSGVARPLDRDASLLDGWSRDQLSHSHASGVVVREESEVYEKAGCLGGRVGGSPRGGRGGGGSGRSLRISEGTGESVSEY